MHKKRKIHQAYEAKIHFGPIDDSFENYHVKKFNTKFLKIYRRLFLLRFIDPVYSIQIYIYIGRVWIFSFSINSYGFSMINHSIEIIVVNRPTDLTSLLYWWYLIGRSSCNQGYKKGMKYVSSMLVNHPKAERIACAA